MLEYFCMGVVSYLCILNARGSLGTAGQSQPHHVISIRNTTIPTISKHGTTPQSHLRVAFGHAGSLLPLSIFLTCLAFDPAVWASRVRGVAVGVESHWRQPFCLGRNHPNEASCPVCFSGASLQFALPIIILWLVVRLARRRSRRGSTFACST